MINASEQEKRTEEQSAGLGERLIAIFETRNELVAMGDYVLHDKHHSNIVPDGETGKFTTHPVFSMVDQAGARLQAQIASLGLSKEHCEKIFDEVLRAEGDESFLPTELKR
jgi:hypothetical protein